MCDVLASILLGDENVKDQGGSLWEAGQFCETLLLQIVKPGSLVLISYQWLRFPDILCWKTESYIRCQPQNIPPRTVGKVCFWWTGTLLHEYWMNSIGWFPSPIIIHPRGGSHRCLDSELTPLPHSHGIFRNSWEGITENSDGTVGWANLQPPETGCGPLPGLQVYFISVTLGNIWRLLIDPSNFCFKTTCNSRHVFTSLGKHPSRVWGSPMKVLKSSCLVTKVHRGTLFHKANRGSGNNS